ncbi:MAG TPA: DegV family protein [Anaerolineae bacterium]|nr:DegV family protein [Anaerolineae bacterium]
MIRIVSDTTTGLSRELAAQHGIDLVSQVVMFGAETLRDGVDITNEVFLQRLKMSKEFPTTSQPPVGDFVEVFKRQLDAGHEILCITVSSLLSGTYNSAAQAKEQLGSDRITLVDSRHVATAEALLVLEAAHRVQAGQEVAAIVARLDEMIPKMRMDFVLDTLEYLAKGGRIGGAQAFVGTLLQMKPILTIANGRVEPLERVRTKAKAVARLRDIVDAAVRGKRKIYLGVTHTGLPTAAAALSAEFCQTYNLDESLVIEMPPAVAAHTGPGALGAAYYAED